MAALAGPGAGTPGSGARDLFAEGLLEFLRHPAAAQLDFRTSRGQVPAGGGRPAGAGI
uniref:Uncharacterized protein n=1 Tax=Chelonoidis abingdonii TaxID=106734 RepID=A0A8C0G959_CHEAB